MKNILIVTGGNVDYEWAKKWIKEISFDYVIAADSGLVHCDRLKIKVDYLLGDYDSVDKNVFEKYNKSTETDLYFSEGYPCISVLTTTSACDSELGYRIV